MAKKVLELVQCCDDCARKSYYSGGRSMCNEADTILPANEGHKIPEWCPLSDYPSDLMAKQNERIAELEAMLIKTAPRSPR